MLAEGRGAGALQAEQAVLYNDIYIYIYIYTHVHVHMYIYIYRERERHTHYIHIIYTLLYDIILKALCGRPAADCRRVEAAGLLLALRLRGGSDHHGG